MKPSAQVLTAVVLVVVCNSVSSTNRKPGSDEFLQYCGACHSIYCNRANGPKLEGVIGRKAASVPDYDDYSSALKASDIVWLMEKIDQWLIDPQAMLPGTTMPSDLPFRNATAEERKKIVHFLSDPDASADICP